MTRSVLDTSILLTYWIQRRLARESAAEVRKAAAQLIKGWDTHYIVSPVVIECIAGTKTGHKVN